MFALRSNILKSATVAWIAIISFALAGCSEGSSVLADGSEAAKQQEKLVPEPDYWPTEAWRTAKPDERGMDGKKLTKILDGLPLKPIRSMVVVKDGYIVGEYYKEGNPEKEYEINSVTKSITSALVGIAIEEGKIGDIDDPVLNYFPKLAAEETDADKKSITIAHLLSMTSGLDWPEWTEWNYFVEPMLNSKDWPAFVLQRSMERKPGDAFNYNTGGSQVLATILKTTTGLSEYEYAKNKLFEPIGITRDLFWYGSPDGSNTGGFGLKMSSRDQARFGFLYLHGGKWEDKQIVPADWVTGSTSVHADGVSLFGEYGYHWWVGSLAGERLYDAMGYGGQYIYVVPRRNLVVVFSSDSPEDSTLPQPIMREIIQAVKG
ncbi:serine hydrolase [Cohnella sp. AR92]|uniref:serine hydrolase domain-containing protein n=1 Tax=Cohnella sp. AR92 TaxID=648716 RepID=UPI0013153330|nr:serine hydrolase [Cohnella sp. AR92]